MSLRTIAFGALGLLLSACYAPPRVYPANQPLTVGIPQLGDGLLGDDITEVIRTALRSDSRVVLIPFTPRALKPEDDAPALSNNRNLNFRVQAHHCPVARNQGISYLVTAAFTSGSGTKTECVEKATSDDLHNGAGPDPGDCAMTKVLGEYSWASWEIRVTDVTRCRVVDGLTKTVWSTIEGPPATSLPAAEQAVIRDLAEVVSHLFPVDKAAANTTSPGSAR